MAAGYRELAARFPERIVVLDALATAGEPSRRRCMEHFASVPEQPEAKRLLDAALADGAAHAYLLHGPAGVGKRTAAFAFAAALLGDERRVEARSHPDLYVLEPLGEMIRIDDVRALRHDLHMRPFEADRRVYLVLDAHRMNEDAADALLKDLEEPPPYAVIVLVASELGPLPPTILSRCQLVPFRRLSERAVREWIAAREPATAARRRCGLSRGPPAAGSIARDGCSTPMRPSRREALDRRGALRLPRPRLRAGATPRPCCSTRPARAEPRRRSASRRSSTASTSPPARPTSACVAHSAAPSANELLAGLEGLESWYRDLVVVAAGAEEAVVNADVVDELREDVAGGAGEGAVDAAEAVRETWRALEEFNLNASLALEALFVSIHRALVGKGQALRA